jgi:hypothetical protein
VKTTWQFRQRNMFSENLLYKGRTLGMPQIVQRAFGFDVMATPSVPQLN